MTNQTFWEDLKSGRFAEMIMETAPEHTIKNAEETYNIMKPIFVQENDVEKMYGLFMNGQNNILATDILATGTIGQSSVYPREIIKKMLRHKATSLVISHNHPSGDPHPSSEDKLLTRHIMIALKAIQAELLDHLILGRDTYYSFANENILTRIKSQIKPIFQP